MLVSRTEQNHFVTILIIIEFSKYIHTKFCLVDNFGVTNSTEIELKCRKTISNITDWTRFKFSLYMQNNHLHFHTEFQEHI